MLVAFGVLVGVQPAVQKRKRRDNPPIGFQKDFFILAPSIPIDSFSIPLILIHGVC
jgi:hypothetical protein